MAIKRKRRTPQLFLWVISLVACTIGFHFIGSRTFLRQLSRVRGVSINNAPPNNAIIKRILLVGERRLQTTKTSQMLGACYPTLQVGNVVLASYKEWLHPTPENVKRITNRYLKSISNKSNQSRKDWPRNNPAAKTYFDDTLVMFLVRNPYDWLEQRRRQIMPNQPQSSWKEFVTVNVNLNGASNDGMPPLELRTSMIQDMLNIPKQWQLGGFLTLHQEEVNEQGDGYLLDAISKIVNVQPSCQLDGRPTESESFKLNPKWQDWITEHVDWEIENKVGFKPRPKVLKKEGKSSFKGITDKRRRLKNRMMVTTSTQQGKSASTPGSNEKANAGIKGRQLGQQDRDPPNKNAQRKAQRLQPK